VRSVTPLVALVLITLASPLFAKKNRCSGTANSEVYSDARYIEEAGDVIGLELAIAADGKSVLLYDYQGALSDPVVLPAIYSAGELTVSAGYTRDLIEEPSEKHVIEKHHVELRAHVTPVLLAGTFKTDNLRTEHIRLRKVPFVWGCKGVSAK
jgi:hypothetical protein